MSKIKMALKIYFVIQIPCSLFNIQNDRRVMIGLLLYLLTLLVSLIILYSLFTALFFRRKYNQRFKKDRRMLPGGL